MATEFILLKLRAASLLSQIEPNPNYFPIGLTLAFYHLFVGLVMLGMIVRPFVRP